MLNFLKKEANKTYTENGAATYQSSCSHCLDLFATIGALRRADESEIISRFSLAYAENPDLAMKILFFARDIRGGIGERRVFRVILKHLAENNTQSVEKNIPYIAEYGRYDDLLSLLYTPCQSTALKYIEGQLTEDLENCACNKPVSLLAKWLPSVNASSAETVKNGKLIARSLKISDAQYRKALSLLREKIKIIENNLREKDYTFDYSKQPSKALFKYRMAFMRNDSLRYSEFLHKAAKGEVRLNTSALTPYDIVNPFFAKKGVSTEERKAIDVSWRAQEDFTGDENALVVVDGSGSMYSGGTPLPITVALSLGIYFAERNTGMFKNHFITFSENPQLVEIKGEDIFEKLLYCRSFDEIANTNIQRVFELILNTAVKYHVPQKYMPSRLYIISDMEFDCCVDDASTTNFEYAKKLFALHGYSLPEIIFWNVDSRNRQQPVTLNESGVALVSGCSPRIFSMLKTGIFSPYVFMLDILNSQRYAVISA